MNREGLPVPAQEHEEVEPDLTDMVRSLLYTVKKRKWTILLTLTITTVSIAGGSLFLKNEYQSEATLAVTQAQVSDQIVATDSIPVLEAIAALRQRVLSRTSLIKIIREFNLYPKYSYESEEGLAARMNADIEITPIEARREAVIALRVGYTAETAEMAQKVVERLTREFIDENRRQRGGRIETTTNFLDDQVREAERKLAGQEARLQAYKTRHLNQLPEQATANLTTLSDLRSRLTTSNADLDRARRGLRSIESQVNDKYSRLQSDRADLLKRFTAQHRDVQKVDGDIARYAALKELFSGDGLSSKARLTLAGGEDANVTQLRSQAEEYLEDEQKLRKEQANLEDQIREYQGRLASAPLREQEQAEIMRDYNLYKEDYEKLKAKQLQSGLAMSVEEREEGEQFRLIEPPSLPAVHSAPNRRNITLGGTFVGLLLGFVLAFIRGSVDTTFKNEKEVSRAFRVPLVLGIPQLLTPGEQSAQTRNKVFGWVGCIALLGVVISTEFFIYYHG